MNIIQKIINMRYHKSQEKLGTMTFCKHCSNCIDSHCIAIKFWRDNLNTCAIAKLKEIKEKRK